MTVHVPDMDCDHCPATITKGIQAIDPRPIWTGLP